MTKQQVIDILESYKPSGNIYNGYNSIEEKIDERICYLIDEIIGSVKQEPDNEWMKCSEEMPENGKSVLVVITQDGYTDICVGETYGEGDWMISGEFWYEKSDPAITHWMPLPELPKEGIELQDTKAWDKFKEKINQLQTYKLFQETYLSKQDIIDLVSEIEREENANEEKEVIENKPKEIENNEQIHRNS